MRPGLTELKARYSIAQAWRDLGLEGEPAKSCRSPFPGQHRNGDAHPSFSVYDECRKAKDHATGEHYDVFDFVARVRGSALNEAIAWVRERVGEARPAHRGKMPALRRGTKAELAALARLRGIGVEAVALAEGRGFVHFSELWGMPCWAVTDRRRGLVEFRRLDGWPWPAFGRLAERKSHCLGSGKDWPLGIEEAAACPTVAWFEGVGDFLAFWHFALTEGKVDTVAPVAMLGAANQRVAVDALTAFAGKRVVLYPHCDSAGQAAAKAWARQLRAAGAQVMAFDLSGIEKADGQPGKDLNDLCFISGDCHEASPHFREVLP